MMDLTTSIRISFGLGMLSTAAWLISNLALMDIQHGAGHRLEWGIVHISYALFILFHVSALITLGRLLRKVTERVVEKQ